MVLSGDAKGDVAGKLKCGSGRGSSRELYSSHRRACSQKQAFSLAYINSDSVPKESQKPETNRPMETRAEKSR